MSLATRLRRLEQTIGGVACPSCGRVPGTTRLPNGDEAPLEIQRSSLDGDTSHLPPGECLTCGACLAIRLVYRKPALPSPEEATWD
jgi:hypothetical protein